METAIFIVAIAVFVTLFVAMLREVIRTEVDYVDKIILRPLLEEIRLLRQAAERGVGKRRRDDRRKTQVK